MLWQLASIGVSLMNAHTLKAPPTLDLVWQCSVVVEDDLESTFMQK